MSSSVLDNLPQVIPRKNIELSDVKASNEQDNKPFVIVCSKSLEPSEIELIKDFGKLLIWSESYMNIPLKNHVFDYCVADVNQKSHRQMLMKEDLSNYHVISLVNWHEDSDDFVSDVKSENILHHLPPRMPFKADWDRLLLSKKIRKPSCLKSIGRVILKALNGWEDS